MEHKFKVGDLVHVDIEGIRNRDFGLSSLIPLLSGDEVLRIRSVNNRPSGDVYINIDIVDLKGNGSAVIEHLNDYDYLSVHFKPTFKPTTLNDDLFEV